MESKDKDSTATVRERRMTISGVLKGSSILMSVSVLGMFCYFGTRIVQLEDDHTAMRAMLTQAHVEGTVFKRSVSDSKDASYPFTWIRGPSGEAGRDGRDGRDCVAIDQDDLLREVNQTISQPVLRKLEKTISRIDDLIMKDQDETSEEQVMLGTGGSSYIRWGKTSCDGDAELVYSGFVGGQYYNHNGGASNYICLHPDPEYYRSNPVNPGNYLYGAKYMNVGNLFKKSLANAHVPCARCYVPMRSTTMMIPARENCPKGWTEEYDGYIMSGHYSQPRDYNYVCVDADAEPLRGFTGQSVAALLYPVEAVCSSIQHCPPYIDKHEVTCVVCSRASSGRITSKPGKPAEKVTPKPPGYRG